MADNSQPTPMLDHFRPRVLRALRVRGWRVDPHQHGVTFTARARREVVVDERGTRRCVCATLRFVEAGDHVALDEQGDGARLAVRDLQAEGVLS